MAEVYKILWVFYLSTNMEYDLLPRYTWKCCPHLRQISGNNINAKHHSFKNFIDHNHQIQKVLLIITDSILSLINDERIYLILITFV